MFILIRLTQHISGIIMPIVRTDYVNNCMSGMPVTRKNVKWSMPATRKNVKCSIEIIWWTRLFRHYTSLFSVLQAYSTCSCLHSLFSWRWA